MKFVAWKNKDGMSGPSGDEEDEHVDTRIIRHDKAKRNRACQRCRKAKIKCERSDEEENKPCKRCATHNLQCIVDVLVPGVHIVGGPRSTSSAINENLKDIGTEPNGDGSINKLLNPKPMTPAPNQPAEGSTGWEHSVENRLQKFDTALDDILGLLKDRKDQSQQQRPQQQPPIPYYPMVYPPPLRAPPPSLNSPMQSPGLRQPFQYFPVQAPPPIPQTYHALSHHPPPPPPPQYMKPPTLPPLDHPTRKRSFESTSSSGSSPPSKKQSPASSEEPVDETAPDPLDRIVSLNQAKELFQFFDSHITPQLFGFSISKYKVEDLWDTSPLLVATVCCIASMHHPKLSHLSSKLNSRLHKLTEQVLFNTPRDEVEGFNTIVALCICGFWFQKDQMFTGLALQLAKNMGLNKKSRRTGLGRRVPDQERLKLWYLLYILDGQQALVFNRQPMIESTDQSLGNGMKLLVEERPKEIEKNEEGKSDPVTDTAHYSDLRLVSQVEYNIAISDVFKGDAWDMLAPASFGIPFRTNLELDKWMVHWTVLLSPFHGGSIWSSKSTLIYYNFAKMHINSAAVRNLHTDGQSFPTLSRVESLTEKRLEEISEEPKSGEEDDVDFNEDDEEDDEAPETFLKELSPTESRRTSSQLAISAAQTVLNLVLGDEDILQALRYVPVHIHIMLYYAALLVLNPPEYLRDSLARSGDDVNLESFRLVKRLRGVVASNTPIDERFASKLLSAFDDLLDERFVWFERECKAARDSGQKPPISEDVLEEVKRELQARTTANGILRKEKRQRISAWPGSDHGHP